MQRPHFLDLIKRYFRTHPIVAILGPRQCGKTTLSKMYCEDDLERVNLFDLEDPADILRLQNPKLALEPLKGLIVIDEIQNIPDLFPLLRVLVDRDPEKQFLILGSASRDLVQHSSETLAGRIAYIELSPFELLEVENQTRHWLRGGFPRSYLANSDDDSFAWRSFYISSFLERDIPNLGIEIPAQALRRFWTLLAHYHGNYFNGAEIGRSFGATNVTMRRYLDILSGTFMIRQIQPWFENIKKRQVKSPKIYFRDSGIYHSLLDLVNMSDLQRSPKLGASWEGYALEEVIRSLDRQPVYFWATHSGAELDLLTFKKEKRIGYEFKYADAPKTTKSMHASIETLGLDKLYVIYPGDVAYHLTEKIIVLPLQESIEPAK